MSQLFIHIQPVKHEKCFIYVKALISVVTGILILYLLISLCTLYKMAQTILTLKQICRAIIYIRNTANLKQWLQVSMHLFKCLYRQLGHSGERLEPLLGFQCCLSPLYNLSFCHLLELKVREKSRTLSSQLNPC